MDLASVLAVIVFIFLIAYLLCYNEGEHERRMDNKRKKAKKRQSGWAWVDEEYKEERRVARHDRRQYGKGKLNHELPRKPRKTL